MKKVSSNEMKQSNSHLVLETIIFYHEISRADLSRVTELNKATISSLVQDYIDSGLIIETGSSKDTGGRKAKLLKFNQLAGTVFAIDFGIDIIRSAITDLNGNLLYEKNYEVSSTDLDLQLELLFNIIKDLLQQNEQFQVPVIGLGIAIHGLVSDNYINYVPYYEWRQVDLKSLIEKTFNIPTIVENDSNLFALGEHILSHQDRNILGINISSGVGLGIVIDHKLYHGHSGYAGEIGHMIVQPNGRACTCGNLGCLEQYASERSILKQISTIKGKEIDLDTFITLCILQDEAATQILDDFILYLSIALNNIGTLYNPSTIVVYSYIFHKLPKTIELIKQNLNSKTFKVDLITVSEYKHNAILIGASLSVIKHHLGISRFNLSTTTN